MQLNNVGSCWPAMLRPFARGKSLTGFKHCAATPKHTPKTCNRVCKRMQHVTSNNVASVCAGLYSHFLRKCSTSQGHPTSIFGKYLFRRRFEIQNFRNICCKMSCLPASPRIFEHLKNGTTAHF